MLRQVDQLKKLVCTEADGINLVDDAGGPGGIVEKLKILKDKSSPEAKEIRYWAQYMGWSRKKVKPEEVL